MNWTILGIGIFILMAFATVAAAVALLWAVVLTFLDWREDRRRRRRPW